jgi:hypothetical protein
MDRALGMPSKTRIMSHHTNSGAVTMQITQHLHHHFTIPRIEIAGWLVGKQNRRSSGHRASRCHALLLATGELTRQMPGPVALSQLCLSGMRHTAAANIQDLQ